MKKYIVVIFVLIFSMNAFGQNYKRYAFKSGIIEYKYEGKTTGSETLYFDEYGKKEARFSRTTTKMFGIKTSENKITIMDGATIMTYSQDTGESTQTTNPIYQNISGNEDLDYEEFAQQSMDALGFEKTGTSTVLGKTCDVWEGMGKVHAWKGLGLKTEMNIIGTKFTITATDIKTNVSIPSSKFKIPNGAIPNGSSSASTGSNNENTKGLDNIGNMFKGFGKKGKKKGKAQEENGLDGLMKMFGEATKEYEEGDDSEMSFEDIPELLEEMKKQLKEGENSMCALSYSEFRKKIKESGVQDIDEQELRETYDILQKLCDE